MGVALSFLTDEVTLAGWQVVVMLAGCFGALLCVGAYVWRSYGRGRGAYRSDRFLGMTWRWRYRRGRPVNIWCYCPDDDSELVYSYSQLERQVTFECETCGRRFGQFSGDHNYVRGLVRRQIQRKLRTGEWSAHPTGEGGL